MYPIRFLLPNNNYQNVNIHSQNFPSDIDTQMIFCERNNCFVTTLELPSGNYTYQFNADGQIIDDSLRAPLGGIASLTLGVTDTQGVIFEKDKIFIKNNHIVLTIGLDTSLWQKILLNIQTLSGIESIQGSHVFFEGSYEYRMFVLNIPDNSSILAYFEIGNDEKTCFLGENGLKDQEWAINPIEITSDSPTMIHNSNIVAVYHIANQKAVSEFEKHHTYFDKFPVDHISGDISDSSALYNTLTSFPANNDNQALGCLLRDIFTETRDINPAMGLLGRFIYESKQDIASIPFALSDNEVSFWHVCHRDLAVASRGIGFQLLGTMTPKILFGEEIGLTKTGDSRNMYWTKTKWNKDLHNYYIKLLKLRQEYPVLRQGRFRFVIQDCSMWGIERYMTGEDSIYIITNHSSQNIVVDLTKIMNHTGGIIELLTNHPLKRKKVCTIFGNSVSVFKIDRSNNLHQDDEEE